MADYKKYENMDRKQLVNALTSAEKKLNALQNRFKKEIKTQTDLVSFIKTKIKVSLNTPKYYTLETSPAIKKIDELAKANLELTQQAIKEYEEEKKQWK